MLGRVETRVGIFVLLALAIFIYMGFRIGSFRLDTGHYASYYINFTDVSGLSKKSDVKIAGVKVGWVEHIALSDHGHAQVQIKVLKQYILYQNVRALIRQDGLLGPKYLELMPGDPFLPHLPHDGEFTKTSDGITSTDELLSAMKRIASNVEEVTDSLRSAIGGIAGQEQLKSVINNLQEASGYFASFAGVLDRSLSRNEQHLDQIFQAGTAINSLASKLETDMIPALQSNIERISESFDRDFSRIATKVEATGTMLEDAFLQARDGFKNISSVAEKIDEGKGLIGKLINNDETYNDIRIAADGIKNYFAKIDAMEIIIDSHFESMMRRAENYRYEDAKGYFALRIFPAQDRFYLLQLVTTEKGCVSRFQINKQTLDINGDPIDIAKLDLRDWELIDKVFSKDYQIFTRNTLKIGLQFAKIFNNISCRFGLFESSAGAAIDINVPVTFNDKFRWITTFEAFDLRGWNRFNDRRPHLKWLNRVFFLRNLYFVFGADDFISKHNASLFFGCGIRFSDDDFKYLLSSLAFGFGTLLNNIQCGIPITD